MTDLTASDGIGGTDRGARSLRLRTAFAQEWGLTAALWRRDMLRLAREPSRWLGLLLQPVLFWLVLGSGLADSFHLPGAADTSYLTFSYPGILVMVVLFTTILGTISVVEDRRAGFLQAVLVAPGSRFALVTGKLTGVGTIVLVQSVLFLAAAPLAGYPFGAVCWPSLLLALALTSAGLTAVGVTLAWRLPSVQAYHGVMSVVLIPLWVLSGALFPPSGSWVGVAMAANPLTYAVDAVRAALSGDAAPPSGLLALAGFSVGAVALAVSTCRREGSSSA